MHVHTWCKSHCTRPTLPKMVFFLSSHSQRSSVMKNWLPLVWGSFWLAHASRPLQPRPGPRAHVHGHRCARGPSCEAHSSCACCACPRMQAAGVAVLDAAECCCGGAAC